MGFCDGYESETDVAKAAQTPLKFVQLTLVEAKSVLEFCTSVA